MNRLDYLKAALKAKNYKRKAWIISAFSVIREDHEAYKKDPYPYRLVHTPTGTYCVLENHELERIDDAKVNEPLFHFKESFVVDNSICENVFEPTQATIGQVLVNLIVLIHAFGSRFPFKAGPIKVGDLEKIIASKLRDTPVDEKNRDPNYFYVDEYVVFSNALSFLSGLSQLCVWSNTEKNVLPPPGIKEFKEQLLKKYEGKLSNPVELTKFEKELGEFDDKYLADDPSNGTFITGKLKNNARKKMFLTMGAAMGFEDSMDVVPVINSLDEGWPKDPKQFTAMMNNSRAGSYSRGKETQKGGVSFKVLLRAAGNLKIVQTDCGTKLGIRRNFDRTNIKQLVGREFSTNKGWVLIETIEQANQYLEQPIVVRSPMYCKLDGDNLCAHCAGQRLAQNPTGVSMALTNVSSTIMTDNLKIMHGSVLSTAKMDFKKALT